MADNINVTPGTGATIAAELIGGALLQRVKLAVGALDVDNGDISSANPMPISLTAPIFQSSTAAIAANGIFTSNSFDTSANGGWVSYTAFSVTALNVFFDESPDNINWSLATDSYMVAAGAANYSSHHPSARYCRVRFMNGPTPNAGGFANLTLYICQSVIANETDISISDNFGNPISSVVGGTGNYNLAIAQSATNYAVSTLNSSAVQLAAAATFTGTVDSTFNQQSYTILMVSDQPMIITVLQYIDAAGTQLASSTNFTVLAGAGFARSGVVNGNYVKITAQNTGASTTTAFRLDTAYGTIPSSTQLNNSPVAINEVNGTAITLGQTTMAASFPVVLASNQSAINVGYSDTSTSGSIVALNGAVTITNTQGMNTVTATLSGTWVAVVYAQGFDGTTWVSIALQYVDSFISSGTLANGTVTIPCGGYRQIRLIALSYTSGTINIQMNASVGNYSQQVYNLVSANMPVEAYGNIASGATDSGKPVKVGGVYQTTIPTLTAGQRGDLQVDSRGALITTSLDGARATYAASATNITAALTPTDVFTITGSATKTVRVLKVGISGVQTAAGIISILLLKRSTANTVGTSAASAAVPYDSNAAAATATVLSYTANPTTGTLVGSAIRSGKVLIPAAGTASSGDIQEWFFGDTSGQSIVLRGINQVFAVNLNATTVTGGSLSYYIVWTEE